MTPIDLLEKAIWSEADLDVMGWHDATIHGLGFGYKDDTFDLLIDLDYIVRWIEPVPPETSFEFWVAPATLAFEDALDFEGELSIDFPAEPVQIAGMSRGEPDDEGERKRMAETGALPGTWRVWEESGLVTVSNNISDADRCAPPHKP